jgi:hypothetical protein
MWLHQISNTTAKENRNQINEINDIARWLLYLWSSFDDMLPTQNARVAQLDPALLPLKSGLRRDFEAKYLCSVPKRHLSA